jgi:hypothetical protein
MRSALWALWVVLLVAGQSAASGQSKLRRDDIGAFMESVEALNQKGNGSVAAGVRDVRSHDWPASFYMQSGEGRCSATLVGPQALLLAAQCVGSHPTVIIEFRGLRISSSCTRPAAYGGEAGDRSADFALCYLKVPVSGIQFETVSLNSERIRKGSELLLTGFGCVESVGRTSYAGEGRFHIGEARVIALPGERPEEPNTIVARGGAVICAGDGGGGVFIRMPGAGRRLVAVNSRVNKEAGESYLSSLSSEGGRSFLKKWITETGSEICGINLSGSSCR